MQSGKHPGTTPPAKDADNQDWTLKVKRVTLILTVVTALIAAGVKLFEAMSTAATISPHIQQLQGDLDKTYDRTHRELEKYNNRP
jgi:hypothetical protein